MTTISTSSLSSYSTSFTVAVKKDATTTAADSYASTTTDAASASATPTTAAGGAGAGGAGGAGGASDSSSSSEQAIAKLEEQIKEKSARVMAIQGQISSSTASLATEQAALLQLQKSGSINTTA
jgi:hypothetical protein